LCGDALFFLVIAALFPVEGKFTWGKVLLIRRREREENKRKSIKREGKCQSTPPPPHLSHIPSGYAYLSWIERY
jgi:hypothetical protein